MRASAATPRALIGAAINVGACVGACAALLGCSRNTDRVPEHQSSSLPTADTVAPGMPSMAMRDSAPGALATRREPENWFDDARTHYDAKDNSVAVTALRQASGYFRALRDSTSGMVRTHVDDTERDLDRLAGAAEKHAKVDRQALDMTFARANVTEAERHHARATDEWTRRDTTRTADEMLMAVDHLERAAKDAGMTLDRIGLASAGDARRLGINLLRRAPVIADSTVTRVQRDLERVTQSLRSRVDSANRKPQR